MGTGVKRNIPHGIHPDCISKLNQIKTDIYHRAICTDNIFALGDVALIESDLHPRRFPQLESMAIDQSKNLTNNFLRLVKNKPIVPFQYINKASMTTVGRNKEAVDLANPKLFFSWFFAWLIWMTVHLFLLIELKTG